jgi:adenine-specific DNA-methyltransferase
LKIRINLEILAYNRQPVEETLYDKPIIVPNKTRVTGPFTVEAVPAPYVISRDNLERKDTGLDASITRTGETLRQSEWRDELLKAGVRGKNG